MPVTGTNVVEGLIDHQIVFRTLFVAPPRKKLTSGSGYTPRYGHATGVSFSEPALVACARRAASLRKT
jgi:hypothetical protein